MEKIVWILALTFFALMTIYNLYMWRKDQTIFVAPVIGLMMFIGTLAAYLGYYHLITLVIIFGGLIVFKYRKQMKNKTDKTILDKMKAANTEEPMKALDYFGTADGWAKLVTSKGAKFASFIHTIEVTIIFLIIGVILYFSSLMAEFQDGFLHAMLVMILILPITEYRKMYRIFSKYEMQKNSIAATK
ncbi:hypothetical protein [Methanohalophilus portucalensis]|uniref:Uncharacterized protein n=2 Tax=Methanohalophilus portucalensis TaxID=39664 RepID=A0A1L9C711_9EURY|nr:hypothetical protein [Methanohalophilus portucalensis]ATU08793.1 hypothetical protein BKM01_08440 [Methanohalophilus portucalensis]OJH50201.1 hypothetical protein MPF_0996 [Methanohalophilus portucalensis FDF-1]RNI13029.1 hypothetical protein EFE41_00065 [Methanohalophilus portucalensis FDF-1]SMH30742.1 hypothetical protein SAMN06264941_0357 [Methanohalophilus portucalensis FDF-1]